MDILKEAENYIDFANHYGEANASEEIYNLCCYCVLGTETKKEHEKLVEFFNK